MSAFVDFFKRLFSSSPPSSNPLPKDTVNSVTVPRGFFSDPRGSYGRSSQDGGSKWDWGLSNDGASPAIDHYYARQNSRSAYLDSLQAHAVVGRFADTVVDTGLRLKPKPAWRQLGITPEQAREWSADVEEKFDMWARSKKSHRSEQMSFYQMQRLVSISQPRDGEYFVRLTYNNRKDLINPLQLRLIDPNQIRGFAFTSTQGFQGFADGIKRDEAGREVAYNVYSYDYKNNRYRETVIPAIGPRSGRRMVLHGFAQEWPDQVRGYPRLFHALQEFENLTDFSLAHIKKAINQSNLTMFVKPSDDAPASNPFEEITHNVAGPINASSLSGGAITPAGDLSDSTDLEDRLRYLPIKEATFGVPGSTAVFSLEGGETLEPFRDTAPSEHYSAFIEAFASHLSASLSIPLEVVLMKFNQNYSASRAALILFWRVAQIWRDELASDLLKPVYEEWLAGEIAAGRVRAPGWSDPVLRQCWSECYWNGVPMPNIDPEKTARAEQLYVEAGAQTLQDVAQNYNGSNFEANKAQLREELEDLPIPPWGSKVKDTQGSTMKEEGSEDGQS